MKKLLPLLIGLCFCQYATAENLIEVYEQAKSNNPDLFSAAAQRDKAYAAISGSRASLLPQLGLAGSYGINYGERLSKDQNTKTGNLNVVLSQTLFNFASWKQLDITKKQASIQDIAYQAQEQQLILNSATAYFEVLKSIDALGFLQAQKKAFYRQLDQTQQKHRVGLVAITDVQNVKANYDQTIAQLISAHNMLNNNLENLRQVTGRFYANLATIDTSTFKTTQPAHIDKLLQQAESTNLTLLTAKLAQDMAKEQIRLAESGHMPTLSVKASSGLNRNKYYGDNVNPASMPNNDRINGSNSISLNLELPIFAGGATHSQVKQAQYNYVDYSQKLESANRSTVNLVRSSYNDILAAISSIKAYQQTVVSAKTSLDATESGYKVGTRTIVDVLSATTTLYNAKQQLSNAKYNYLISLLKLKFAIGTLNITDLNYLNNMLGANTNTIIAID
jgi:outer membrane protein